MSRRILVAAILIAVLGALGLGISRKIQERRTAKINEQAEAPSVSVTVVPVEIGTVEKTFVLQGSVEAEVEVGVYAKIPGKLRRVNFKEGDWVPKGALVAELDRDEVVAQVNQARAALAAAKVNAAKARDAYRLQTVSTDTSVDQAAANLASARARLAQAETGIQLTDEDVTTSVASAEEMVRQAQARLDALRAGARTQEREVAKEQVAQAKANMETAKRDLERGRKLFEAQAIAQQQLDALQLRFDVAAAQYQAALQQASLVEEGPRSEEIRAAEAQLAQAKAQLDKALAMRLQVELRKRDVEAAQEGVRQAEAALRLSRASRIRDSISAHDIKAAEAMVSQARANLEYAQAQLANTYIYAQASGYVVKRNFDAGEVVSPSVPIVSLVDNSVVKVKCPLSEERQHLVSEGQIVSITFDALPGAVFTGRVTMISAAASQTSRAFEMHVRVPNPKRLIKSGMFARVTIVEKRESQVPIIPYEAVLTTRGRPSVFVVVGGIARQREVELGLREAEKVAVRRGLSVGEQVVVQGQSALQDGQKVSAVLAKGEGA
jgi:RND family efflux transporter MFP subunit